MKTVSQISTRTKMKKATPMGKDRINDGMKEVSDSYAEEGGLKNEKNK